MFVRRRDTWGAALLDLNRWIFQVALGSYLLFFLLDDLSPGFVSLYFHFNDLLWVILASGAITAWFERGRAPEKNKLTRWDWAWAGLIGLATAGLVWFRVREIGSISVAIGVLSGLIVFLMYFLLANDDERSDQS